MVNNILLISETGRATPILQKNSFPAQVKLFCKIAPYTEFSFLYQMTLVKKNSYQLIPLVE